jgi:NAD dependent epimerase/dehydratase
VTEWEGKRVTVTGAGGFIGSHLAERLVEVGAKVRAAVRYNSRNDRGALEWIAAEALEEIEVHTGDIRDQESVARAVDGSDVVFHLAAHVAIPYSYSDPRSFVETNVLGTLNVAQACRAADVERLIHTSTSEVYGSAQDGSITESHPLLAQSPYAASKIGADQVVTSFHRSFGLRTSILRPFNTFGPRQSARAVVPTIVAQALWADTVRLGSLIPTRDLTFVTDTVEGFLAIAASEVTIGQCLQLGTGAEHSISQVVDEVATLLGRELQVEQDPERVRPASSEVMRLRSSPERIKQLTGWEAQTPLAEGLAQTVDWIEAHPGLYRINEYAI